MKTILIANLQIIKSSTAWAAMPAIMQIGRLTAIRVRENFMPKRPAS